MNIVSPCLYPASGTHIHMTCFLQPPGLLFQVDAITREVYTASPFTFYGSTSLFVNRESCSLEGKASRVAAHMHLTRSCVYRVLSIHT